MVNKFSEGRVFVAGGPCYNLVKNTEEFGSKIMLPDAAHVHSITGGQGMNSSIQDSVSAFATNVYMSLTHGSIAQFSMEIGPCAKGAR